MGDEDPIVRDLDGRSRDRGGLPLLRLRHRLRGVRRGEVHDVPVRVRVLGAARHRQRRAEAERSFSWIGDMFSMNTPHGAVQLEDVRAVWLRQPM